MLIKQISIFIENKMGRMAEITKIIGDADIDIRALSMADTSDFGILRLIVNKPDLAVEKLKEAGLTVSLTDVIAVGIDDKPGMFAGVVSTMADAGINIEYMYAFITREHNRAYVILRVEAAEKALQILSDTGIYIVTASEIYDM